MTGDLAEFADLLTSKAVAFVSTLGRNGEPHVTPLWFLWDGEEVRFSLVEGRQKLRNLLRDPRISVAIADPARPTYYVELRGTVRALVPDPEYELERLIATKYVGSWVDVEPPGAMRFAGSIEIERITGQRGAP